MALNRLYEEDMGSFDLSCEYSPTLNDLGNYLITLVGLPVCLLTKLWMGIHEIYEG